MNLFNSVILLFVVHPFDVGDALLITTTTTGSGAAEYCVVEELSLVVTTSTLAISRNCAINSAYPPCCLLHASPSRNRYYALLLVGWIAWQSCF